MIPFQEAHELVLAETKDFGTETVDLLASKGRILAENIYADRDFPPFNRATKDGIAICFSAYKNGQKNFIIEGIAAAGNPEKELKNKKNCLEVMTGAIVPKGADTVIMYEDILLENGQAKINISNIKKGQNIHFQGTDAQKDNLLITKGKLISATEIGIFATLGKMEIKVKKLPKIALVSTGNELVAIHETPKPYQIRRSNIYSLKAALQAQNIDAKDYHITDNKNDLTTEIANLLAENDVLLLSGGVSKGKYDFLPEVFEKLAVQKIFHKVKQRPGKPFWFGKHEATNTLIFSFPGNPSSTFITFHVYFMAWLRASLGLEKRWFQGALTQNVKPMNTFTFLKQVKCTFDNGKVLLSPISSSGSGDLLSLTRSNGVAILPPKDTEYKKGELVWFVRYFGYAQ